MEASYLRCSRQKPDRSTPGIAQENAGVWEIHKEQTCGCLIARETHRKRRGSHKCRRTRHVHLLSSTYKTVYRVRKSENLITIGRIMKKAA